MEVVNSSAPVPQSELRLNPVSVPKASEVLADELRERILNGDLAEGAPLPAERELVRQTQMSRATVREALRILEVQNLIRVRSGRSGGAFVQRPTASFMTNSVSMLIRGRGIKLVDLLETREALEPHCAELAARNRSHADIAALERANTAIEARGAGLEQFLDANLDWHVGVAVASHNDLLIGFMVALSRAVYASTDDESFVDDEVRALTGRAHRAITDAIRAGDAAGARRRMARHVHSYADAITATGPRDAMVIAESAWVGD